MVIEYCGCATDWPVNTELAIMALGADANVYETTIEPELSVEPEVVPYANNAEFLV